MLQSDGEPVNQSKPASLKTDRKDLTGQIRKKTGLKWPYGQARNHISTGAIAMAKKGYLRYHQGTAEAGAILI